jgi:hypothetical protein
MLAVAMRRLTFGSLFLVALVVAGCDQLSKLKGGGDAGVEAAALPITPGVDAAAAPVTPATTVTPVTPPLTPPTPVPTGPGPHPVAGDGGAHGVDAGHPTADGGKPPPAPTPTLTIPAIPTVLPFDAGAFRLPDGGFKPPF